MKKIILIIMLTGFLANGSANAVEYFVNIATGNDSSNGLSFNSPFKNLQFAIDEAADGDTIILTSSLGSPENVYYPTEFPDGADTNDPRNKAFHTNGKNIAFLGGTGGFDYLKKLPTVLSGDIDGDETLSGNVYHVFILDGLDNTTRLDRMQIQGGNADGSSSYVYSYTNPDSVVVNTTISNDVGGGLYINNSSPLLIANYFRDNYSDTDGAGLYNLNSSPQIFNSIFYNNTAANDGAGIFNNNSFPEIVNTSFIQNTAMNDGGGVYNQSPSVATIYSTLFYDNTAVVGTDIAGVNINSLSSHNASDGNGGNIASGQNFIDLTAFSASDIFVDITDPNITHDIITFPLPPIAVGFEPAASSPLINAGLTSANTILQPPFNHVLPLGNSQLIDLSTRVRSRGCTVDIGAYEGSLPVTIYVDSSASNNVGGDSWSDPVRDLQFALDCATSVDTFESILGDTIKVAQGIYKPTQSPDDVSIDPRDKAFHLDKSIYLKGGYDPLTGLQDLKTPSVLSGDFNDDDVITGSGVNLAISNNTENAYHVMITSELIYNDIDIDFTAGEIVELSLMDNFKIQGGNANGDSSVISFSDHDFERRIGGGMTTYETITRISNVTFYANSAVFGGGYYEDRHTTLFNDVKFINNIALNRGGGIFSSANSVLTNAVFSGNKAVDGGGLESIQGSLLIINALFIGNAASEEGGGFLSRTPQNISRIYNSTFINNIATNSGGGFFFSDHNAVNITRPIIKNSVFFNNTAASFPDLSVRKDTTNVGFTQGVHPDSTNNASDGTGGNIDAAGVFVDLSSKTFADLFQNGLDPDGNDNIFATADDGLVPSFDSALTDMGTNNLGTVITNDLAGVPRFYPSDSIDIGAYEYFVDEVFLDGFE